MNRSERQVIEKIREQNPGWSEHDGVCSRCVDYYHTELVMQQRILPEIGPHFPIRSADDFVILPTGLRLDTDQRFTGKGVTICFIDSGFHPRPDLTAHRNRQVGSNGLAIDKEGRLIMDQHGNRWVIRIEKKGPVTFLADKINGKRFNSPNDIVLKNDGSIYFTDPPYGLPDFFNDSKKELDYQGVFMIKNGRVQLISKDLGVPNGAGFLAR